MKASFDTIISDITCPSRYLGNEINSVHKNLDQVAVTVLLAFPDLYEVGMSHLGFQILYHILNSQDDVAAERVFAPWKDMEQMLRQKNIPLLSLESRYPINLFDIIGFSLQYELSYTNLLNILDLGKIPLRASQRDRNNPLIIGGGPSAFNPEPVAQFFDAFVIGEGEEAILDVVETFKDWKRTKRNRSYLLDMLTSISGVYVPSKFEVTYSSHGPIEKIKPLQDRYTTIEKRVVSDLNEVKYPAKFVVPYTRIVHDRINLEIARGCTRGCRFCQAGMIYRPVRERHFSTLEKVAEKSFGLTGWEELSLLSLSSGDYSGIEELLTRLIAKSSQHNATISLPSLRAETLKLNLLNIKRAGRKIGFTIAPEAGTERLRRVINKGLNESEILETCQNVFSAGWQNIKLYFMIGLPTETTRDLEEIIRLAEKAWDQGKGLKQKRQVTVSISTFIPKPHTPFQWESMISPEEIKFRQKHISRLLRRDRFRFKWQDPYISLLEGVISRGDRRLADVIEEAFKNGCRFDGWTECFDYQIWEKAFNNLGINTHLYLNSKDRSEILPWDHINSRVKKEYLWKECVNSKNEVETRDCRFSECNNCGVCDFKSVRPRIEPFKSQGGKIISNKKAAPTDKTSRIRLQFSKTGEARFLSHLEMARVFARAASRAKLPIRYTQGYHPQPRIIFGPALPVGFESLAEQVDIELQHDISSETVKNSFNDELPTGITILSGEKIALKTPAISDSLERVCYSIPCGDKGIFKNFSHANLKKSINGFLQKTKFPIVKSRKGKMDTIDIRPLVENLSFLNKTTLELILNQSIRPTDILKAVFGFSEAELTSLPILKIRMTLKEK
ncbi:MAG: TIGR03960 family B12-binding radical SAM protein [Proteobacteria bacterium]|nr:TIGR03960 family B12-binding radical SAM protein [Pseudomonadota bacterium]